MAGHPETNSPLIPRDKHVVFVLFVLICTVCVVLHNKI